MKNVFVFLAATSLILCACTGRTKEEADQTNRDSVESKSTTDSTMNSGVDTSGAQNNPAAPAATNAQY
jgi:hypothetical protein